MKFNSPLIKVALFIGMLFFLYSCGGEDSTKDSSSEASSSSVISSSSQASSSSAVSSSSQAGCKIVSYGTNSESGLIQNILMPNKNAIITMEQVNITSATIMLQTKAGTVSIDADDILISNNTINFTVPDKTVKGDLSVKINDTSTINVPYSVFASDDILLINTSLNTAHPGDTITVKAINLPDKTVNLILDSGDWNSTIEVTPRKNDFSFQVPQDAKSCSIYIQEGNTTSNTLILNITRSIKASVKLPDKLNISAENIFIIRGSSYSPDANYNVTLNVQNNKTDFISVVANYADDTNGLLYEAVILPGESEITLNALSTAVKMIFYGAGYQLYAPKEQLSDIKLKIESNNDVIALASYIETLQKDNISGWINFNDRLLLEKYTKALNSVNKNIVSSKISRSSEKYHERGIDFFQTPGTGFFSDINFRSGAIGTVILRNDTRLTVSFEAKDAKTGALVDPNYRFINGLTDERHMLKPGRWTIASNKQLELGGKDTNVTIITGGFGLPTASNLDVRNYLAFRALLEGIAFPLFDSAVAIFFDKSMTKDDTNALRIINIMKDYFGEQIVWAVLKDKAGAGGDLRAAANIIIVDPILNAVSDCPNIATGQGSTCKAFIEILASIAGVNVDIDSLSTSFINKAVSSLLPGYGQVKNALSTMKHVNNGLSMVETAISLGIAPGEIHTNIDFLLEITEADPLCFASASKLEAGVQKSLNIKGKDFDDQLGMIPKVYIGKVEADENDINVINDTEMTAAFNGNKLTELVTQGGGEYDLTVQKEQEAVFEKKIRSVNGEDGVMFTDSWTQTQVAPNSTFTILGCGFLPKKDMEVFFTKKNGEKTEAEITFVSTEKLEVTVPKDAVSGHVYIQNKSNSKLKDIYNVAVGELLQVSMTLDVDPCNNQDVWDGLVTLSAPKGCKIIYTLDESDPFVNGKEYTAPIPISYQQKIKAACITKEGAKSLVNSREFYICGSTSGSLMCSFWCNM